MRPPPPRTDRGRGPVAVGLRDGVRGCGEGGAEKGSRAATAPRPPAPLPWRADRHQGPQRRPLHADPVRLAGDAADPAAIRRRQCPASPPGRIRVSRQALDERTGRHAGHRARHPPADAQSLEPRPFRRRLERRIGGRGGRGDAPGGAGLRRRRLDPDPVVVLRDLWPQALARSGHEPIPPARSEDPLHLRTDGPDGRGCGGTPRRDGGHRHRENPLGTAAAAAVRRAPGADREVEDQGGGVERGRRHRSRCARRRPPHRPGSGADGAYRRGRASA